MARRGAMVTIDEMLTTKRPSTLILLSPDYVRENFDRFDFIECIIILVPQYNSVKDTLRARNWISRSD